MNGKEVILIDSVDCIFNKYLDFEFIDVIEDILIECGIKFVLGQIVQKFIGENGKVMKVIILKGEFEIDFVILCIGFCLNIELFKGQVDMLLNGVIIVDKYM